MIMKHHHDETIEQLLSKMTLQEKIGQMTQMAYYGAEVVGPQLDTSRVATLIEEGRVGSILSVSNPFIIRELQTKALKSRLGIPLFFAYDVLYGYKTIFPINLALSSTFNVGLIEEISRHIAYETAHSGIHMTFAPMLDVVRDPRWGRVMESFGEDPHWGMELAKCYVRGFQQGDLSKEDSIASCAKHFVAYGLSEAGREYNSVDVSKDRLNNLYLPPFQAAVEAGVAGIMTSFNVVDGIPMTIHKPLVRELLKEKWEFDGVVITDYAATTELMHHKTARNTMDVSSRSLDAGIDIEMASTAFLSSMEEAVQNDPQRLIWLDDAVRRILALKKNLGLFKNPYKGMVDDPTSFYRRKESISLARQAAVESIVLLKNDNKTLPLKKSVNKIALIGPHGKNKNVLGFWSAKGESNDCISLYESLCEVQLFEVLSHEACSFEGTDTSGFEEAITIAKTADVIIAAVGEPAWMSGEGGSRSDIKLPGVQESLLLELSKLDIPIVVVLMNGRPLDLSAVVGFKNVNSILECWYLGNETGHGIVDILTGIANPSGKLPISFPRTIGQIPIYYNHLNTGRPITRTDNPRRFLSRYLDIPNDPLYPFGHGMSYSDFQFCRFRTNKSRYEQGETIVLEADVENISERDGHVVIQVYIECLFSTVSRPVMELKAVWKAFVPKQSVFHYQHRLIVQELGYASENGSIIVDPGFYKIRIGDSSHKTVEIQIEVMKRES